MASQQEVDLGEIIRTLLRQERQMLDTFEKTEISIEKSKKEIDSKVTKILKKEREKTEKEAEKLIEEQKEVSIAESNKLLKKQKAEIKKFENDVEKQKDKIIDLSLQKIVQEVQDAISE